MNIFEAFFSQARHQPAALAICAPGTKYNIVSYGRLESFANNVADQALKSGIKSGDIVAIFTNDSIFHWALILGLGRIGAVTLSGLDPNLPSDFHIDAVLTDIKAKYVNGGPLISVDHSWLEGDGKSPAAEMETDRQAVARIILTSGTTGRSKAVALSHDNVIRRIQAYDVAFGNRLPACSRTFVDVGIGANIGYLWTIYIFARGGAVFLRGSDPAETLQAFSLYNVQGMVASTGGMAEFLDYYERSPAFSCPFEVMLSVGSMLSKSLSDRVRRRMCSYVVSGYGATEVSPVAGAPTHHISDTPGAVGYVAPGIVIETVDESNRALEAGAEGIVRIRGHTCVNGYLGNPPGSETVFRDGWFYPGDIGKVNDKRLLVIAGREKNIIDLGGDKINPEGIEAVLAGYPGVIHAVAFGSPNELGIEEVWAAIVTSAPVESDAIFEYCGRRLPRDRIPVQISRVAEMPRSASGKIDRRQLIEIVKSPSDLVVERILSRFSV